MKSAERATPQSGLEPALPMQLLRAREAVMQRFRPYLRKQRLTDQQGRILRILAETGTLEMGELAERTSIQPASLSRIVPRLQAKGIVRRSKVDTDARRVVVSITKRGRAAVMPVMRASRRIYEELAAELGANRFADLLRSLDMLIHPRARTMAGYAGATRKGRGNGVAEAYTASD